MPRNGSGVYTLPQPSFVAGTVISSAAVNSDFTDIASALTGSLPRDGQAGMLGQFKATDGSTPVPSITYVADTTTGFSRSVSGPNSQIGVSIGGVNVGNFTTLGWSGNLTSPASVVGINGAIPVGACTDFAGSSAPQFWLLCQGQAVSRSTYSALFAVIGTQYGAGDGSTTFNVPDYRGKSSYAPDAGAGVLTSTYYGNNPNVLGAFGGAQQVTLAASQIPGITSNQNGIGISVSAGVNLASSNGTIQNGGFSGGAGANIPFSNAGVFGQTTTLTGSINVNTSSNNTGGQPHTNVSPGIIMSKIIFAGA